MFDWFPTMQLPSAPLPAWPFAGVAGTACAAHRQATQEGATTSDPSSLCGVSIPELALRHVHPYVQMTLLIQQLSLLQLRQLYLMSAQTQQLAEQLMQVLEQNAPGMDDLGQAPLASPASPWMAQASVQGQAGSPLPLNLSAASLQRLLQLDASPEMLAYLQKFLDTAFALVDRRN